MLVWRSVLAVPDSRLHLEMLAACLHCFSECGQCSNDMNIPFNWKTTPTLVLSLWVDGSVAQLNSTYLAPYEQQKNSFISVPDTLVLMEFSENLRLNIKMVTALKRRVSYILPSCLPAEEKSIGNIIGSIHLQVKAMKLKRVSYYNVC